MLGEYRAVEYFHLGFKWILLVFGAKMKLQPSSRILKLAGVWKWGKMKEKGRTGFEASTCFMAWGVSEVYKSRYVVWRQ